MHMSGASLPPVYPGAGRPLRGGRIDRSVSCAIHGPGGLGDLFKKRLPPSGLPPAGRIPADRILAGLARQFRGALRIIAIGPLTNLARAVRLDRKALAGVGRIVIMGGAAQMPGNATPAAEFNIHCDPEAAAVVMGCGAPITMVGLDVTRRALLPSSSLKGGGSFCLALRDLVRPYAAFSRKHRGVDGVILHDPLAVAAAIDPGLLGCRSREVVVECGKGPARGMTVVDLRAGSPSQGRGVDVALEVDEKRFIRFFLGRLRKFRGWS
jgi:purine nucleosidase/pyrimidine-specific ribonucleoside hydrolase